MATDEKPRTKDDEVPESAVGDSGDGSADEPRKPTRRPAQGPRVGVAQIEPALGDIETNFERHAKAAEKAQAEGIDILVFPELSLTGYRLKDTVPDVALTRSDPVVERLAALSKDISLVVGLVLEAKDHSFFNGAAYLEDGEIVHVHRKVYLPTYGMFDEQRYFARGNRLSAFDTKHGRMAVLICEDMLHPSAVTIAALDGASTIVVPSASPVRGVTGGDETETEVPGGGVDANGRNWESYNRTMARTLGVFVVHANRVGVEDGQTFWGGSEIIGPDGETLAKAAYYDADSIHAVLPDSSIRRQRIQAPVLRDEDVDLTINELCRVRGRLRPSFPREEGRGRGDSRGFDRSRPREGGGGFGRGRDRDDRGQDRRDNRGGDRRDSRGFERRDDRRDNRSFDRRDDRRGERRDDRRDDRRDKRPRPPRDGDRPLERRPRPGGENFGGGYGKPRDDDRSGDGYGPPRRERPGRGERKPRPVGGGRGRGRDKGGS